LSFSETKDDKLVYVLNFLEGELKAIESVSVPVFRRLKTIQGELEDVQEKLTTFAARHQQERMPWVEVIIDTKSFLPQLDQLLRDFTKEMNLELVKIRINRPFESLDKRLVAAPDLESLEVEEVFRQKCLSQGAIEEEKLEELVLSFRELQEWMTQQD
jgi:exonuclease SbcD